MAGFKERLIRSLQFRISFWLSLAILGVSVVAGVQAFRAAFHEAHELQDDDLWQFAIMFENQHMTTFPAHEHRELNDIDVEDRILVQRLGVSGPQPDALALPANLQDGLQNVTLDGRIYRVLVRTTPSGERIAVSQDTAARDEIARLGGEHSRTPLLVVVPILIVMITVLVRRNFKRVVQIAQEVDRRSEHELHHLEYRQLPTEIQPFIVAINRLLDRIALSMANQRRFVADAAHELRSPMTALSLQAEQLAKTEMSDKARERLSVLRQGIDRGRALLDQLLTLARAQASTEAVPGTASVQRAVKDVLESLLPIAEAKEIEVGVSGEADAHVAMTSFDLGTLIKNLVDNAIRYTQTGGRIDVMIEDGAQTVRVAVEDNGPGIPESERARVFDPFYRVLGNEGTGSGLGLSIVRTIADRYGVLVVLGDAMLTDQGVCVSLIFPKGERLAPS
ncbi:MAG: two-component sensor histidine kinase [Burkholderiales bacterium]|nr:two-component sensor histidine kinase [Burkholderiales bacterium]